MCECATRVARICRRIFESFKENIAHNTNDQAQSLSKTGIVYHMWSNSNCTVQVHSSGLHIVHEFELHG